MNTRIPKGKPLVLATLFLLPYGIAWSEPILQGPGVISSDFRITTFASGLDFPYSMAMLANGSIIAATTAPPVGFGNGDALFYFGAGALRVFTDSNVDGIADGPGAIVAQFPGAITSIRPIGDMVAVATTGGGSPALAGIGNIHFLRPGASPSDPYTDLGSIQFAYPTNFKNMALAVKDGSSPGAYELYFSIPPAVFDGGPSGPTTLSGLVNTVVPSNALYRVDVTQTAGTPSIGAPVQIASGIRTTSGILVDSGGNIIFGDNGDFGSESGLGADELNIRPAGASGVVDFGYPGSYVTYPTGVPVGSQTAPLTAFLPFGGIEMFGISEIAFSPSSFPAALQNGVFATFHGNYLGAGTSNVTNPVVFINLTTGSYFPFVPPGIASIGHIDTVLATQNSLFLADFSSTGAFDPGSGVIYQIQYPADVASIPEPASAISVGFGLAVLAFLIHRRTGRA